jgi:AcrR family transcriptional regulator
MKNAQWLGHDATDRRSRVLQAAQVVFARKGFHAAEVKDIAEAAGVSKATIYKIFRSKEEILGTIISENFAELRAILLAQMLGPGEPTQRFRRMLYAAAAYLDGNKPFCQVLLRDGGEFMTSIRDHYGTLVRENTPMAEAFFGHLRQRGDIPDLATPDLLKLLTNAGIGILYGWVLTDSGRLVDEVDFYLDVFDRKLRIWRLPAVPTA